MSYLVTVSRANDWWLVAVPQLAGLTQAGRPEEAELMAQEFIALSLSMPRETVAVQLLVEPPGH